MEDVTNDSISNAVRILRQKADWYDWSDDKLARDLREIANHLIAEKSVECDECGEDKTYVQEAMVSGVVGWFCDNKDCMMDS